jgi:hypothetical protein
MQPTGPKGQETAFWEEVSVCIPPIEDRKVDAVLDLPIEPGDSYRATIPTVGAGSVIKFATNTGAWVLGLGFEPQL